MKGRLSKQSSEAKVEPQQPSVVAKKPRGRPRKHFPYTVANDTNSQGRDIRPLLEKLILKKKLANFKEAL